MTLIHVIGFQVLIPKRAEHRNPAHPQNNFLAKAVMIVSAVEIIGQSLVPGAILRKRRIQEIYRNTVSEFAGKKITPGPYFNCAAFDSDGG